MEIVSLLLITYIVSVILLIYNFIVSVIVTKKLHILIIYEKSPFKKIMEAKTQEFIIEKVNWDLI